MALLNRDEPWCISQGDIDLIDKFKDMRLNDILWELGMDIKKGYEIQVCNHRSICTNIVYKNGTRYFGVERQDVQHLRWKGINI